MAISATDFCRGLGVTAPIIQAPMAQASTIDLAVAVSSAGGLGSLAAGLLTPDQIRAAIRSIRAATDHPFSVNLFTMELAPPDPARMAKARELIAEIERTVGADQFEFEPPPPPPPVEQQLAVIIDEGVPAFSFTFGVPSSSQIKGLIDGGAVVLGTATTSEEARVLEEAGVSAVVAQGIEAGGHRGSFLNDGARPTEDLVVECCATVKVPVIASGGIMNGLDINRMLGRGAAAVQLGTAFLACPETALLTPWRDAILAGGETVVTRTLTGKFARAIRNRIIDLLEPHEGDLPAFPYVAVLTARLRAWAAAHGIADFLPLLAGQGVIQVRDLPAAELIATLMAEAEAAGT